MAEITKLSVGQALDKLRRTDEPESKMARHDRKIQELDEEIQRLRTMRLRLERNELGSSIDRDAQESNARSVTKLKILGIIVGIVIAISVLAVGVLIAVANT
jgi:hypothetical protein